MVSICAYIVIIVFTMRGDGEKSCWFDDFSNSYN